MESDDDFEFFSHSSESPSSPIHHRRLKRLKKAVRVPNSPILQHSDPTPSLNDSQPLTDADQAAPETLGVEKSEDLIYPVLESEGFDDEKDETEDLIADRDPKPGDSLDLEEKSRPGASDAAAEEFDGKERGGSHKLGDEVADAEMEKSVKKLNKSEEVEEEKNDKSVGDNEKLVDSFRSIMESEGFDDETEDLIADRDLESRETMDLEEKSNLGVSDVAIEEFDGNEAWASDKLGDVADAKLEKSLKKLNTLKKVEEKNGKSGGDNEKLADSLQSILESKKKKRAKSVGDNMKLADSLQSILESKKKKRAKSVGDNTKLANSLQSILESKKKKRAKSIGDNTKLADSLQSILESKKKRKRSKGVFNDEKLVDIQSGSKSTTLDGERDKATEEFDGKEGNTGDRLGDEIGEQKKKSTKRRLTMEEGQEKKKQKMGKSVGDDVKLVDLIRKKSHLGVSDATSEEFDGKEGNIGDRLVDEIEEGKRKKSAKRRLTMEEGEEKEQNETGKSVGDNVKLVDLIGKKSRSGVSDVAREEFDAKKGSTGLGDEIAEVKMKKPTKKPTKKRLKLEEGEEKKKKSKSVGCNEKPESSARAKKKLEKERKVHLEKLHAESQRLLRETRDAAFKPAPAVHKPISSVLEKIRRRKLEVLKNIGIIKNCVETNDFPREVSIDHHTEQVNGDGLENKEINDSPKVVSFDRHLEQVNNEELANEETNDPPIVVSIGHHSEQVSNDGLLNKDHAEEDRDVHLGKVQDNDLNNDLNATCEVSSREPTSLPSQHEYILPDIGLDEAKTAFRAPINDTEDLFGSQQRDDEDLQSDSQEDSPLEEVFAPSLLAMNLKLDSAPPDDVVSDEEDNDKENFDPRPPKPVNGDLYPKGDPVKAFVDDEAEEEDDSDNDLMRFQDNEEDEEHGDIEEFKDLIATGYKEKPIDNVMRDQLHQKWLEQQDAAATDNILQRLNCGWTHKEPISLEEEEEEDEENSDGESVYEAADLRPTNVARINAKKVKQMIPLMFTEKDDDFPSSDDEETKQKIDKQRFLEQAEKHTSFLSPADDENSREVFGMIKKLNVAPDTKRKAKSSFFDMLVTGGNSNGASKSSFLGRASTNSLPPLRKSGSSNFRSFIFGRDDSNSRGGITTSEACADVVEKESRPTKTATAKFSNSQSKFSSQTTSTTKKSSGTSLLEILRRSSSMQSDGCARVGQTQASVQFAAFKSTKKSIKIEART